MLWMCRLRGSTPRLQLLGGTGAIGHLSVCLFATLASQSFFDACVREFYFPSKGGANGHFADPSRCADSRNTVCFFFFVSGPHAGPMQTVCPCNVLTEEPHPLFFGGGVLKKGLMRPLRPLWSYFPPALAAHLTRALWIRLYAHTGVLGPLWYRPCWARDASLCARQPVPHAL